MGGLGAHASPDAPDARRAVHAHLALVASCRPLLIGCDLERLDPFTLNLLTNDEVLAVNQDPLGKQAVPVVDADSIQVWVKELEGEGSPWASSTPARRPGSSRSTRTGAGFAPG